MAAVTSLFGGRGSRYGKSGRRDPRKAARFRPALERLEERKVMDASCPATLVDDMTELARLYPTKTAPTMLYLNFDGQSSEGVGAFRGTQTDIQQILFRTSEVFSPFNVQVQRKFGNGNFDGGTSGNTTIFIGDHPTYTRTGNNGGMINGRGGFAFADHAKPDTNTHDLNSNPFDVAYVDPWNGAQDWDNLTIAQAVAHEAGHTFGLAHVLSAPLQDVMSYDATNRAFLNSTLDVTTLNQTANGVVPTPSLQPVWYQCLELPTPVGTVKTGIPFYFNDIVTQNSFATLSHLLGRRSTSGDEGNVADEYAVDYGVRPTSFRRLTPGASYSSSVNRPGDYDVYEFMPSTNGAVRVEVERVGRNVLLPTLMLYDPDTDRMLDVRFDGGSVESTYTKLVAGRSYRLIVGALDSTASGAYRINVNAGEDLGANPTLDLQALAASQNGTIDLVTLENFSGAFRMLVNGKMVYSDQTVDLQSVTVKGTNDNESFRVKHSLPFSATIRGGAGVNSIEGPNVANQWLIDGFHSGTLNATTRFFEMNNLTGGSAADTFGFTPSGRVYFVQGGGSSQDVLDYSRFTTGVWVDLSWGKASNVSGIGGIENAIGGSQADQLFGDAGVNLLRGGGGGDTLKGGGGNDSLYGDAGLDSLYGEGGLDFLDGGLDYLVDLLIGDNAGAADEADIYINHMRSYPNNAWVPEWESNGTRPLDAIVLIHG